MRLSPPISILIILAASMIGVASMTPTEPEAAEVVVLIPAATYNKLAGWSKTDTDMNGASLSVAHIIAELVRERARNGESTAN